jgi:hypothetical protein
LPRRWQPCRVGVDLVAIEREVRVDTGFEAFAPKCKGTRERPDHADLDCTARRLGARTGQKNRRIKNGSSAGNQISAVDGRLAFPFEVARILGFSSIRVAIYFLESLAPRCGWKPRLQ